MVKNRIEESRRNAVPQNGIRQPGQLLPLDGVVHAESAIVRGLNTYAGEVLKSLSEVKGSWPVSVLSLNAKPYRIPELLGIDDSIYKRFLSNLRRFRILEPQHSITRTTGNHLRDEIAYSRDEIAASAVLLAAYRRLRQTVTGDAGFNLFFTTYTLAQRELGENHPFVQIITPPINPANKRKSKTIEELDSDSRKDNTAFSKEHNMVKQTTPVGEKAEADTANSFTKESGFNRTRRNIIASINYLEGSSTARQNLKDQLVRWDSQKVRGLYELPRLGDIVLYGRVNQLIEASLQRLLQQGEQFDRNVEFAMLFIGEAIRVLKAEEMSYERDFHVFLNDKLDSDCWTLRIITKQVLHYMQQDERINMWHIYDACAEKMKALFLISPQELAAYKH